MSERNQEGRSDDYDSSHRSGHPGKQHGVDNDSDHSRVPFYEAALHQRLTLARRWRQVGIRTPFSAPRGRCATPKPPVMSPFSGRTGPEPNGKRQPRAPNSW